MIASNEDKARKKGSSKAVFTGSSACMSTDRPRFVQIEITTACNFRCFYCAGRDMPQKHMEWERFAEIMQRQPPGRFKVSLQGEGEPMAHPRFWDLVELVARKGKIPYTITNCSLLDTSRAAMVFPEIGISLDTLDPGEAQRIGRYGLAKVLRNLEALIESMGADRIIVHTVDYGQPLEELQRFLGARGIRRHMIQPLQSKADYSCRYCDVLPAQVVAYHYRCKYVLQPIMRYYNIEGREMPCCFIKDASAFESTAQVHADLQQRRLPASCIGCREISGRTP